MCYGVYMVVCKVCHKKYKGITNTHLRTHKLTIRSYELTFGVRVQTFPIRVSSLPKDDPRYVAWRRSTLNRPAVWNKGLTKETHASLTKTSQTLMNKKVNNFSAWRKEQRRLGNVPDYKPFAHTASLAFLIGLILGDGHIYDTGRTEGLRITLGTDKPELIEYAVKKLREVIRKEPGRYYPKHSNCCVLRMYQRHLSSRLYVPLGKRLNQVIVLPKWVTRDREMLRWCIRGLYEAEGSYSVHEPTYTHKFCFKNRNDSLLKIVYNALVLFGFHPHTSKYLVQVSRKQEVQDVRKFLAFRDYRI